MIKLSYNNAEFNINVFEILMFRLELLRMNKEFFDAL